MRGLTLLLAAIVAVAAALAGCGQTGALYLPQDEPPASAPQDETEQAEDES